MRKYFNLTQLFVTTALTTFVLSSQAQPMMQSENLTMAPVVEMQDSVGEAPFKLNCEEAKFVKLLNKYRQSKGLQKVVVSKSAVNAARWHSQDMINKNYFSHTEPNGRRFFTRSNSFGYTAHSENIAAGNREAEKTFCQWKNSPGHDANMQGQHKSMGIGQVSGGGQYKVYWSNNFGVEVTDAIKVPLTLEPNCVMPTVLPTCS